MTPRLMAVLNVTPDSFSDGGRYVAAREAVEAGLRMRDEGADLVDVGGESTRPGATPVEDDEELRRVVPVVEGLANAGVFVSIDTMKPRVARLAIAAGAQMVNDVSGLRDPGMVDVLREFRPTVCTMHMRGTPTTMQADTHYEDIVEEVRAELVASAERAVAAGVERTKVYLDPGIGFGKGDEGNRALLRAIPRLKEAGYPVLIGVSRKGFIGRVLHGLPSGERLEGTLATQVLAQAWGADMIRTHDVRAARRAIDMAGWLLEGTMPVYRHA